MDWDLHLADAGYDMLHDYSAWRWIVSSPEFHAVAKDSRGSPPPSRLAFRA